MKKTKYMIAGVLALSLSCQTALSARETGSNPVRDSIKSEILYMPVDQTLSRNLTTGSARSYDGSILEKYPSVNVINGFTGVIPGLVVTENTGATGVMYESNNLSMLIRNRSVKFIVDDVYIPSLNEVTLNPEEIESITVGSDIIDRAKYGPEVANGFVYIRTTRGVAGKRVINAGFEKGVDIIDRMPDYVDGVSYAQLNNQARSSSGYQVRFSNLAIAAFNEHEEMNPVYPNVEYKSKIIKNTRDYNKGYLNIRGGSRNMLYSGDLGFVNQGDIYKIGAPTNYNRFNAKMNIDLDITQKLKFDFSFLGIISIRRSLLSAYGEGGTEQSFNNIWSRICNTPAVEYPLYRDIDPETGFINYAVTSAYPHHPYASVLTGRYNERTRTGITKAKLSYDLGDFIPGLKEETQISYNVSYTVRGGQGSDYIAWIYNPLDDSRAVTSHTGAAQSTESQYKGHSFLHGLQFHEKLSWDFDRNGHGIKADFTYYRSKTGLSGDSDYHRQQNYILSASYNYRGRYILEAVGNYAGTSARALGHRYAMFPSAGIGWIVSDEAFMQGTEWLDYLKLRAQAGAIGVENYGSQYDWESYYTTTGSAGYGPYAGTEQWFGTGSYASTGTNAERVANVGMGWVTNKEYSFGADAVLFKHLSVAYTHFHQLNDGILVDALDVLPYFFGLSSMMDNYNQNVYWGDELSLSYGDKHGDFRYNASASFAHWMGKYQRYSETTTFSNLKKEGTMHGDVFGYDYAGKFQSQTETRDSKQTFDAQYFIGDLKYNDITGDGVIDSNDRKVIGNTNPKLYYSINIELGYRNWGFTLVGTGKAFFDTYLTSCSYFMNGWGDGNYSKFVFDPLYPRLAYIKSNSNFLTSNYWRVDGGFFKIQNVELAYNFKFKPGNKMGISGLRLFARGANLLTITNVPYVDPESINAGVSMYPLFKTATGGVKITF